MIKLVILYAPQDTAVKKFAESVQKAFDKKAFKVAVKSANKAQLADLSAADAVILGSLAGDGAAVHSDFAEFVRAFSGINYAGRSAAFFAEKGSSTVQEFSRALADTDISIFDETLAYEEKGVEAQKIKRWAAQYSSYIRKNLHE